MCHHMGKAPPDCLPKFSTMEKAQILDLVLYEARVQQSCSSLLVSFEDKVLLSKPEIAKLVERGSDIGKKLQRPSA